MIKHRITHIAAVALAIAAAAAPAASAMPADAPVANSEGLPQDLRSPDTRDAAEGRRIQTPAPPETPRQDFRHPDTRDFAEGRGTYNSPEVVVVRASPPAAQPAVGGIDWQESGSAPAACSASRCSASAARLRSCTGAARDSSPVDDRPAATACSTVAASVRSVPRSTVSIRSGPAPRRRPGPLLRDTRPHARRILSGLPRGTVSGALHSVS